jgi:DNA-directed RNA polymerase II subunit RPB1
MGDEYAFDDSIQQIERIDFDILGNDEIKSMSALGNGIGITFAELHENNEPKKGGLIDPRLGTCSNDVICATCGFNTTYCVGHFGHIDLAEVVFHIGYLPFVHRTLSCICIRCSNLLVNKNENEIKEMLKTKTPKERMAYFKSASKNVTYCNNPSFGCGAQIPKIKIEKKKKSAEINIIAEIDIKEEGKDGKESKNDKKKLRQILTPDIIYDILKNISDDNCVILGYDPKRSRPEDMLHKTFPVPPVQMRPSAKGDYMGGASMEDDLTYKLADIVKNNMRIIKNKENQNENSGKYNLGLTHLLQYHVGTYIENESMTLPRSEQKGKPFKSLASRFKGKFGRVRGNLMGKRGDFTGRTVITSDPTIDNNELGVPVKIAMNLTFPEVVTPDNIEKLNKLVKNGRDVYPGANFVFPVSQAFNGKRILPIDLRYKKEATELHYGDVVERHLQDGDVVLLNRQPTLHKQSMMGHRIKVINDPALMTYRLSLSSTTPYNADFDGDEMNIFLPQSLQTQIELEEIACVEKQIITPTTSKTIVGIVQDGLLGAYNLSSPTIKIDWRSAMNIMSYTTLEDFKTIKKNKEYTGSEIYSLIVPPGININKATLKIKNGQLIEGRLSKDVLGAKKKNNLVQLIWDGYGVKTTKEFIDNTQRLVNNFNLWHGFSVGIGDAYVSDEIHQQIDKLFETKEKKVEHMITELENNPDFMSSDLFDQRIFSELNIVRDDVSKLVMGNMSETNAFRIMSASGSKGDATNIGQMSGCLGLQAIEGKIAPKKYNNRTSAYFHQNDDRAESRGLVKQSFISGIEYPQFVFHLMAARLGLIDTTIKTAETGYTQRKLVKMMEDVLVCNDATVRTSNNRIIQFVYGDSGVDTTKQYEYMIKMIEMDNETINKKFVFTPSEIKSNKNITDKDNKKVYDTVLNLRDSLRISTQRAKMNYIVLVTNFMLPVNINRIVDTVRNNNDKGKEKGDNKISPKYILDSIEKLLENENTMLMYISNKNRKNKDSFKVKDEKLHKTVFRAALYDSIHPKKIMIEYGLNKHQFDEIIKNMSNAFNKNMIEPGEMVGVIAAQSTGEPLTQMTLNSFHHSGIASMSATVQGVPRMKELLSVSKKPKTPQTVIYLENKYMESKDMAHKIASHIKHTSLKDIRGRINVYYDPNPTDANSFMENDNVKHVFAQHKGTKISCQSDISGLPWLMRIEFNREKMLDKEVTLLEIKSKFCSWWEKRFADPKSIKKEEKKVLNKIVTIAVLSNSDNDTQPILHIRFNVKDANKNKDTNKDKFNISTIDNFIDFVIDKFKLKGIDSITDISAIQEERKMIFNSETGAVDRKNQQVIYAAGVNFNDLRYLIGIDLDKTISNHVVEVYEVFGIEIARSVLLREISNAYERAGGEVNYQHVTMIVDQMTATGKINSVDRHGMNKSDSDPLTKASFEKTVEQLLTASVYGESDYMRGVSSRIMVGSVVKGGTGYCDIELNTDMIEKSEYIEDSDVTNTFSGVNKTSLADDIMNKTSKDIFVPM